MPGNSRRREGGKTREKDINQYNMADICFDFVIGLATEQERHVEQGKEKKFIGSNRQAESRMAPRRSKRTAKKDEGTSNQGKKRGGKQEGDQMKMIIDSYMEGNPKEVRDQINS